MLAAAQEAHRGRAAGLQRSIMDTYTRALGANLGPKHPSTLNSACNPGLAGSFLGLGECAKVRLMDMQTLCATDNIKVSSGKFNFTGKSEIRLNTSIYIPIHSSCQ